MFTIEFPKTTRLVFSWKFSKLVINPRDSEKHDVHAVPLDRVIDSDYGRDNDSPWFAFYEEDCFAPPAYIVRASSFESAYEDFCDEVLQEVKPEDLDAEQRAMLEDKEGNMPDGYSYTSGGRLVHHENVTGYEIKLIEVTCE